MLGGRGCRKRQGGRGKKGGGRGVGKGVGRGFNRIFEQNRYRIIQFGYRNAHYETKSAKIAGNPRILGVSPYYDIIISQKRHVLAPKSPKTRCAGDFT